MNKFILLAFVGVAMAATAQEEKWCPAKKADCRNTYAQCGPWATRGECTANPNFMVQYCQNSCCPICTKEEPKPDPKVCPAKFEDCKRNTQDSCQTWAKDGQCTKNAAWMIPNCQQSCCDVCQIGKDKCPTLKTDELCQNEFQGDDAKTVLTAAQRNCDAAALAKDCAVCAKDLTAALCVADATVDCFQYRQCAKNQALIKATDDKCAAWAKRDQCNANPVWMKENCPKSCCEICISRPPAIQPVFQQPRAVGYGYNQFPAFGGYGGYGLPGYAGVPFRG